MKFQNYFMVLVLCATSLLGCSEPEAIKTCVEKEGMLPICGLQNPEDIESLGDGRTLILSQMAVASQPQSGSLAWFDVVTQKAKVLDVFDDAQFQSWGQSQCLPPGPELSPHGFHLQRLSDQLQRLLVVNHGGRETIEAFEIRPLGPGFDIRWVGCVTLPENNFVNDVVADGSGGFYTTHMFEKQGFQLGSLVWPHLQGVMGFRTGWIWHWQSPEGRSPGFTQLAFPLAAPNGIQMDAAGKYLFVNEWGRNKVHKLSLPKGELVASLDIQYADNIQWDEQGKLLVVSQDFSLTELTFCLTLEQGACAAKFAVYRIEPDSFKAQKIFEHQGAPMGAATVAQPLGEHLYLGTFAGDRLLRIENRLLSTLGIVEPKP